MCNRCNVARTRARRLWRRRRTRGWWLRGVRGGLGGVTGEREDAAEAGPRRVVAPDADIAVLTPPGAPRVFDLPVVGGGVGAGGVGAVADEEHAVIDIGAAAGVEDAAGVELERPLVGLYGDGHRLLRGRGQQLLRLVARDCMRAGRLCGGLCRGPPRRSWCGICARWHA